MRSSHEGAAPGLRPKLRQPPIPFGDVGKWILMLFIAIRKSIKINFPQVCCCFPQSHPCQITAIGVCLIIEHDATPKQ